MDAEAAPEDGSSGAKAVARSPLVPTSARPAPPLATPSCAPVRGAPPRVTRTGRGSPTRPPICGVSGVRACGLTCRHSSILTRGAGGRVSEPASAPRTGARSIVIVVPAALRAPSEAVVAAGGAASIGRGATPVTRKGCEAPTPRRAGAVTGAPRGDGAEVPGAVGPLSSSAVSGLGRGREPGSVGRAPASFTTIMRPRLCGRGNSPGGADLPVRLDPDSATASYVVVAVRPIAADGPRASVVSHGPPPAIARTPAPAR